MRKRWKKREKVHMRLPVRRMRMGRREEGDW
jgi:hypothetical protein